MRRPRKRSTDGRVAAYIRVSTEEQAREGISLEAQEARISAYCQMRGLDVVEVVVDAGVSAGKPLSSRDGGRTVLALVRAKEVSGVVAFKLDRLFRNAADCLTVVSQWDKAGVSLHLVDLGGQAVDTASAMGRFFLTVMAGAAELERNQVAERTSAAMQQKISNGEYTGGRVRYGYRLLDDGAMESDPEEQAAISAAVELRGRGLSLRAVSRALAERGYVSRTGRRFVPHQVGKMVAIESV